MIVAGIGVILSVIGIYAVRCMPVQHPWQYISLRFLNAEKREMEVGVVRDLRQWPADAQELIRESVENRYFVHTIQGIKTIDLISGYLAFDAETDLGPMQFMIRWQGDRAHDYGQGGKMLIDTDENRYLIPDIEALPARDRELFQRFIYW